MLSHHLEGGTGRGCISGARKSGRPAQQFGQARRQVGDCLHFRDLVGVDFHLELVLKLEDNRNQVRESRASSSRSRDSGSIIALRAFGGDASDRFGDGGKDIGASGAGGAGCRLRCTPRFGGPRNELPCSAGETEGTRPESPFARRVGSGRGRSSRRAWPGRSCSLSPISSNPLPVLDLDSAIVGEMRLYRVPDHGFRQKPAWIRLHRKWDYTLRSPRKLIYNPHVAEARSFPVESLATNRPDKRVVRASSFRDAFPHCMFSSKSTP